LVTHRNPSLRDRRTRCGRENSEDKERNRHAHPWKDHRAPDQIETVEADVKTFQAMLDSSEDLRRLVRSPVIPADGQLRALTTLLGKAGISGLTSNFIKLLTRNRIFVDRTRDIGVISREDAIDYALSGPNAACRRDRRNGRVALQFAQQREDLFSATARRLGNYPVRRR
jgi:hypothetical protein